MRAIARPALAASVAVGVVAACTPAPPTSPHPAAKLPAAFDGPPAAWRGAVEAAYRLVPGDSRVVVRVYSAGPLADLGHNHTVATSRLAGCALVNGAGATWVGLWLAVADLEVDRAADRDRAGEGFQDAVSEEDATATRANMLGAEGLAAERFPRVRFSGVLKPSADALSGSLTIRGVTRPVELSASVARAPDTVTASGSTTLAQTAFGITPYSTLMGALQVADEVDLSYDLTFAPDGDAPCARREGGKRSG